MVPSIESVLRKTVLLILLLVGTMIVADSPSLRERIAKYFSPPLVLASDEALLKEFHTRCEGRPVYYSGCTVQERAGALSTARSREVREHRTTHLYPMENLVDSVLKGAAGLLVFLLFLSLVYDLSRYLKAGELEFHPPDSIRNAFQFFRSRSAEREFMRYKRLFDNGLITGEEFAKHKEALKPRILNDDR